MALVSNKIQRQLSTTKFPPEFDVKVDKKKISFGVLQKWAEKRIEELIGFEDEILVDTLFNKLTEGSEPNIKETQLLMTEMLREHTAGFCLELWKLILSAQESEGGVPKELVAAKREQIEKERIEEAKALQAAIGRQAAEHKHEQSMNRIRDRERLDRRGARNDPSDNRTRSLSRHSRTRSKSPSLPRYPKRSHPPSHSRSPPRYRARRYPSSRSRSPSRRHQDREYSYSRSKSSSHRRRRYSRSRSRSPSRRRGHKRHSYSRSRSHSRRRQYRHYSSSRSRSPHRRRYDRYFSRSRSRDFRRYRRQSPTPPPRLRHRSPQYWREGDPFDSDVPRRNTSNPIIPSSGPDDRKGDEDYGDDDGDYGEGDEGDEEGDHGNNDRIDNNGAGKNGANNADAINDSAHSDGAHDNGADNAGAGNNDDATNGGAVNDGGVNKDSPPE